MGYNYLLWTPFPDNLTGLYLFRMLNLSVMVFYLCLLMVLYIVRRKEAHLISHLPPPPKKKKKWWWWGDTPCICNQKGIPVLWISFWCRISADSLSFCTSSPSFLHLYNQFTSLADILAYPRSQIKRKQVLIDEIPVLEKRVLRSKSFFVSE